MMAHPQTSSALAALATTLETLDWVASVAAKGEGRDQDIATVASDVAADARELMRDGLELH